MTVHPEVETPGGGSTRRVDASTRYLCAGAHVDPAFTRDVLRLILGQPRRAVGPANGVDTALVIRHCIAANRRRLLRDCGLTLVLAAMVWAWVTQRPGGVVAGLVAAWGLVFLERAVIRFEVLAVRLRAHGWSPYLPTSARLQARLDEIVTAQSDNVTVFDAYDPFVGSGVKVGAWSFVVDLTKGKDELGARRRPEPVDVGELRHRVTEAVQATGIDGLTVEEVVHAAEEAVAGLPLLRTNRLGRPSGFLDAAVVRKLRNTPTDGRRHFQRIQVTAWGGELVVTIFLRFLEIRGRLYAEATYKLLSPVAHSWRVVDRIEPAPMPLEILRMTGASILAAIPALLLAPLHLLGEAWRACVSQPLKRWEEGVAIRDGGLPQCGTLTTVRQRGASTAYWRYFQHLDEERYVKLLERSILDTVVGVLDEHGVDTSELVERQTTILNEGVMMTGGTLQAQSLAVGRGAGISKKARQLAAKTRAA
jgi:hypothetical protein